MTFRLLPILLLFPASTALAQVGVKGTEVVKDAPVDMQPVASTPATPEGASAQGDFDVPPAHPECEARTGQDRLDCTAAIALELIRSRNGAPRLDLAQWGSTMVTISLSINQFGEPKDVRLMQVGDPDLQRNVTTALHALPNLRPATKEEVRAPCVLVLHYPYAELFSTR